MIRPWYWPLFDFDKFLFNLEFEFNWLMIDAKEKEDAVEDLEEEEEVLEGMFSKIYPTFYTLESVIYVNTNIKKLK